MAEQRPTADTFLDRLLSFVSPREAEAKVRTLDPQSEEYRRNIATQNAPDMDAFRRVLYQTILQKAEAEPREAQVGMAPLRGGRYGEFTSGAANQGRYDRAGEFIAPPDAIRLSAELPWYQRVARFDPKTTLVHELLHFLSQEYGYSGTDTREHQLIDYLLGKRDMVARPGGGAKATIGEPMGQLPKELATPETYEFLKRLFAGTPLESGVLDRPRDAPKLPEAGLQAPSTWEPYLAQWLSETAERELR